MFQYFPEILKQVVVLFIMIGVGVVLTKVKKLDSSGVKQMTNVLLTVVTVSVILKAFSSVEMSYSSVKEMFLSSFALIVTTVIGIILAYLVFRRCDPEKSAVLQFGSIYSNCGFMAIPVTQAVFGDEGVFVVSIYMAVFQITAWTYGVFLFLKNRSGQKLNLKGIFLNSGVIGVGLGLIIFISGIKLPELISAPIDGFAALNTPLAMIVTGYFLTEIEKKIDKTDLYILVGCLLRLIIIPLTGLTVLYFAGVRGLTLAACVVPMCAPSASYTVMFAARYGGDEVLGSRFMSICTVLSVITMPLMISLAKYLA